MFKSRISAAVTEKLSGWEKPHAKNCRVLLRHGRTCSKMRWEILWTGEQKDRAVIQSFQVLAWMIITSRRRNWNQLENWPHYALRLSQNAFVWHELVDLTILWSVNKLARSVTKWSRACDRRLARLTAYIHHTHDHRHFCHVRNTAQHCLLGLFQDSDFAGDLEDSKSTSGGSRCIFGSRTFVPTFCMCKKQASVSHSSTEFWSYFFGRWSSPGRYLRSRSLIFGCWSVTFCCEHAHIKQWEITVEKERYTSKYRETQHAEKSGAQLPKPSCCFFFFLKKNGNRDVDELLNVDHVVTNASSSSQFWSSVVYFRRHWSCDQNDQKRQKSCDETRVQNPQSCVKLVVWQSQFGYVRCCLELRKHCLHAACNDRRLAASESMLVAQTVFEVTLRWSVRLPPSRGRVWWLVGERMFFFFGNFGLSTLPATFFLLWSTLKTHQIWRGVVCFSCPQRRCRPWLQRICRE